MHSGRQPKVGSTSHRRLNYSVQLVTRCATRSSAVRSLQKDPSPVGHGYSTESRFKVKGSDSSWSACGLHRQPTPRERIRNSVLSIYQPHTKKGFYEDHFSVWHKLIESREKFHWPRLFQEDVVELTSEQLHWLMDGYDVWARPHKAVTFTHVS